MSEPGTKTMPLERCPVCGRELPPTVPPSHCPHCLQRPQPPGGVTKPQRDRTDPAGTSSGRALPQPGDSLGHYRLGRVLGEGGMGAVFEAEDLDNGRRVALKVLGHRLDSPEARSRFFREGRLAASVNHPNSVYVFGTEDIGGVPVIAMELVAGGTLHDRVMRQGPMPVGEAVVSGLEIIAGLEAAQQAGVLHRDIKPSNCFVELDGTVKIGDYGLSISTLVRTEPAITTTGSFLGTPAFASPEQFRGDELTVRSDIYSVGVTLYFLLTGRHPFDAPDVVRLLAAVLERKAESPAKWRPELPAGLCRVVLRCLEKDPGKRFRNYDELRGALLPFTAPASTPATIGLRFVAYVLDTALLALPVSLGNMMVNLLSAGGPAGHVRLAEALLAQLAVYRPSALLLQNLCGLVLALAYYTWLEGTWGASVGKRICGLRVAGLDQAIPGWRRALARALIITGTPFVLWLLGWTAARAWGDGGSVQQLAAVIGLVVLPARLAIFVTARRRNGYAGVHDLATTTRVVLKSAYQARPALPAVSGSPPEFEARPLLGPYHVLERIGRQDGAELLLGFDTRLLRHVWIRTQPPGAPPTSACLRQLRRPGRLRWLTARRTDTDSWDAYEAASGRPFLSVIAQPQEWGRVRYWLLDLAEELRAAARDGTLPDTLSLGRVWITADGRAKLLDFAGPEGGGSRAGEPAGRDTCAATPQLFLKLVADSALHGRFADSATTASAGPVPLPLHAFRFLETLGPDADLNLSQTALRKLLPLPARVSRARRGLLLAGALAGPILIAGLAWGIAGFKRHFLNAAPELATLSECLTHYDQFKREASQQNRVHSEVIAAFETYIAGRFAHTITNGAEWDKPVTRAVIPSPLREEAEQIVRRQTAPGTAELSAAADRLEQFFKKPPEVAAREGLQQANLFLGALTVGYAATLVIVVIPCLVASLILRGGALASVLGIAFVDRLNLPASRWRIVMRNLLAWLPLVLIPVAAKIADGMPFIAGLVVMLMAGISLLLPNRGLQDRLAGTWPVPR